MKYQLSAWLTLFALAQHTFCHAIIIDFNSLPSAQGWTYEAEEYVGGLPEASVFSVNGSVLSMNTMGTGWASYPGQQHYAWYRQYNVINPNESASLSWTSRTLEYEQDADNVAGFAVGFFDGAYEYAAGLRTNTIGLASSSGGAVRIDFDTTSFHAYRIEADLMAHTYDFYIDNALVAPDIAAFPIVSTDGVFFGDSSNSGNARAEITAFSLVQPIPEPSTVALLLMSTSLLAFRRRSK